MLTQPEVKSRIPHTWSLFFAKHGRFTPIQQQTIPPILDGEDVLAIAATASGKTEAVIAPLLERLWDSLQHACRLQLLYICPTRALVRDLYERLLPILDDTGISIGMKTGDAARRRDTPSILITTPESVDSMLTRSPKMFIGLQAIVLDEIHLFDNTPRGDHVRCLLPRIERIRQYARPEAAPMQRAALSATVHHPAGVAERYLHEGIIVQVHGGREIEADIRPLYDLSELINALDTRPARKTLLFCNSRREVEETAVYLRQNLSHHADIFVHYSNLDGGMRRDVETRFAEAATAVCVSTSTLELGIDIGSVDDVVLLGAPPNPNAFLQRIGRGSRRTDQTRALCMPKTPGEWARFDAFLTLANTADPRSLPADPLRCTFRPSTLIQQIFSFIRQNPTGSIRLADVRRFAPPEVDDETIRKIVAHLAFDGYLQTGRVGEWRPDEKLKILLDQHEIYSNIGADVMGITAVDARTGRTLAYTDRSYPPGTVVLFNGQPMEVRWEERYRFGLAHAPGKKVNAPLLFRKSYVAIPFAVTRTIAIALNVDADEMTTLPQGGGQYLFHFWGTIWGELLAAVLVAQGVQAEAVNEFCLYVELPLEKLPAWNGQIAEKAARQTAVMLANRLQMGRFHRMLPTAVARKAVISQLNLPLFGKKYQAVQLRPRPKLQERLHQLIA